MMTPHDLVTALGRSELTRLLGVGPTAISNAVVRGRFPAAWYVALADLAARQGLACPPALFHMRALPEALPDALLSTDAPSPDAIAAAPALTEPQP